MLYQWFIWKYTETICIYLAWICPVTDKISTTVNWRADGKWALHHLRVDESVFGCFFYSFFRSFPCARLISHWTRNRANAANKRARGRMRMVNKRHAVGQRRVVGLLHNHLIHTDKFFTLCVCVYLVLVVRRLHFGWFAAPYPLLNDAPSAQTHAHTHTENLYIFCVCVCFVFLIHTAFDTDKIFSVVRLNSIL